MQKNRLKTFFSILLFIAFAIRPIYHVGYVAYFQLNIEYIIETYCVNKEEPKLECNGKCHLAKQLSTTSGIENETTDYSLLVEAFYPLYFQNSDYKIIENISKPNFKHKWYYYFNDKNHYYSECFQPPKLLSYFTV